MKRENKAKTTDKDEIFQSVISYQTVILKELSKIKLDGQAKKSFLQELLPILIQMETELSTSSSFQTIFDEKLTVFEAKEKIKIFIILFNILDTNMIITTLRSLDYLNRYPGILNIIVESLEFASQEQLLSKEKITLLLTVLQGEPFEEKSSLLHVTARTGSHEITSLMLTEMKASSLKLQDAQGKTPLHLARDEKTKIILLERDLAEILSTSDGAFLKLVTNEGENWLHYLAGLQFSVSIAANVQAATQKLLNSSVDPYARSQAGKTAFQCLDQKNDGFRLSTLFRKDVLFSEFLGVKEQTDRITKFLSGVLSKPEQSHFMLLSGPPGVGKTELIKKTVESQNFQLIPWVSGDREDKYVGQLDARMNKFFDDAIRSGKPVCLFMDEMDALTPEYEGAAQASSYNPDQLVTLIQARINDLQTKKTKVVLIGATNYLFKVKPAIKSRAGVNVVHFTLPNLETRRIIIIDFLRLHNLANPKIIDLIAEATTGWSPRLLTIYLQNVIENSAFLLTDDFFIKAFEPIRQSFMEETKKEIKEADIKPPTLKMQKGDLEENLVGINAEVKVALMSVDSFLQDSKEFLRVGVAPPNILLHGPPGTGKTSFAQAVANHSNALFISISGGVFQSFDSANKLKKVFEIAKRFEKAVIFIDEIDSIAMEHSTTREVLQTEMDGFVKNSNVLIVIGATNYLKKIADPVQRRFTSVHVPLPGPVERAQLFEHFLADPRRLDFYDAKIRENRKAIATELASDSKSLSPSDIKRIIDTMIGNRVTFKVRGIPDSPITLQMLKDAVKKEVASKSSGIVSPNLQSFMPPADLRRVLGQGASSIPGENQAMSPSSSSSLISSFPSVITS